MSIGEGTAIKVAARCLHDVCASQFEQELAGSYQYCRRDLQSRCAGSILRNPSIMRIQCLRAACCLLLFVHATACSESGWNELDDPASTRSSEWIQLAANARDALAQQLMSELTSAIATGGPPSGIRVCKERAPEIARSVGEKHGVTIGRTSFRLRNPENRAPDWARESVRARVAEPRYFESARGHFAALFPIRLAANCTICHGRSESIAPDVRAALRKAYPEDRATGFSPTDLRGWFWVEVP